MIAPYQSQIPSTFRWDILAQVIGGLAVVLIVGLVGYLFRRRSPQAASWNERKAAIYERISTLLYQVIQAQEPLSADEEAAEEYPEPKRLADADRVRLVKQSVAAREEIQALLKRYGIRLAPRANEIIDTFFRKLRDPDVMDTTRPGLIVLRLAQDAYRDLEEFLHAELGADRSVSWRLRLLRRWLDLRWYVLKGQVRGILWRLDTRVEDFGLLTGPQLTQDNVRNPPRAEIWKTVEQMEAGRRSRVEIQRELHRQLAADPPPWLPVPLAGPFRVWRDPESRMPSPRLHDEKLGPLRTGDAADVCAHGVLLTKACRPCGFVVMPKDFAWGTDLPEEDRRPRRRTVRPRSGS